MESARWRWTSRLRAAIHHPLPQSSHHRRSTTTPPIATECRPCAELTLAKLLLANEYGDENRIDGFSTKHYEHHPSFAHLEQAADDGCSLCRLILDCFKCAPRVYSAEWPSKMEADIERSMYAAAKRLDVSSVKLTLASSSAETLWNKRVRVFDEMDVRIGSYNMGPRFRKGWVGMYDCDDDYIPPLRLTLTSPRDWTNEIDGFQIGRNQLDPDLASDVNHGIARGWLEECRATHKKCMPSKPPQLPTRVVDVGTSSLDAARIIHSGGLAAEYIALSHCWGGHIATSLTSKTASQFQHALPQNELPANFRDSITIARQLGIRYLWIDSLCILQDSVQDWEQESQKMVTVYGNATLTLAAMAASDSSVGLFTNDPIPTPQPPPVYLRIPPSGRYAYYIFAHREDPGGECLSRLVQSAPLSFRGWALQESVLSRRTLFYGARQIYWSCPQAYHAADGLCQFNKAPETRYPHTSKLLDTSTLPTTTDTGILLEEYYHMIKRYSHRALTYPSDKFPAIAGLARLLQPALKTEYLAGLWVSDIHRGLLWYSCARGRHVVPARAPTWSWAAADRNLVFKFPAVYDSNWAGGRSFAGRSGSMVEVEDGELVPTGEGGNVKFVPKTRLIELVKSGAMMELKGWEVVPTGEDGFREVLAGRLVLKTRLMELVKSEQQWPRGSNDGMLWFDKQELREDGQGVSRAIRVMEGFVLTVRISEVGKYDEVFEMDRGAEMERGYFLMLVHADKEDKEDYRYLNISSLHRRRRLWTKCLVVKRVEGGNDMEFERVGMALVENIKAAWLDSWEPCVLTLV